ncbi:MAG: hypothetical protein ACK4SF_04340 [Algoriphagus aquaeductus]|uniref:hypothetical protein n=1 Tax=Algoriphagus aquaeductus TaxID=475299 RepID=UPI00391BEFF2
MNNPNPFEEVKAYVDQWADNTDQVLLQMLRRYDVGITEDLYNSVRSRVYERSSAMIGYDLTFLLHGRFRDMGAGRGRGKDKSVKLESSTTNREIIRSRGRTKLKPAKWYSKPFYGRLNMLQGVIGIRAMEQSIQVVRKQLTDDQT